jgi:hypothetical protein
LKVPVIAFTAFIVVTDLANAGTTIKQRIFQAVCSRQNRQRNPPEHHLHDRAIVVIDSLAEEQFGFHSALMMAL